MSGVKAGPRPGTPGRFAASWLSPLALLCGTGLLAAGYALDGPQAWTAAAGLVPAVLWVSARSRRWAPGLDASVVAFVVLAGLGLWIGVGVGWMVPATVAGLAAWDLSHLQQRLARAGHVTGRDTVEARHFLHLLPTLLAGLALALVAARTRLNLGFLPVLLLGVLAIAGLARTVFYLRRGG